MLRAACGIIIAILGREQLHCEGWHEALNAANGKPRDNLYVLIEHLEKQERF